MATIEVNSIMKTKAANGDIQEHYLATKTALIKDAGQPGGTATLNANGDLVQMPTLAKVGGSRPNLFINWYFRKLINQRQASVMPGASSYGIDMWLNAAGANIDVHDGYLTLNATSVLSQWLPTELVAYLVGKTVAISCMDTDGTIFSGSIEYPSLGVPATVVDNAYLQIYIPTAANTIVQFYAKQTKNIVAVKLEVGLGSTLAYDPPPDPQQELAKCQRYLQHLHRYCAFVGAVLDIHTIDFYVPLPVPMRVSPAMVNAGGVTINGISGFTIAPAVTYFNDSYVRCRAVKMNHGLTPGALVFASVDTDDVLLSAEL